MSSATKAAKGWFEKRGWQAFPFQEEAWEAYLEGCQGIVNAPTGSGKTYSLGLAILLEFLRDHPDDPGQGNNGLQAIWITPIRALTREIQTSLQTAAKEMGLNWQISIRSGDTSTAERARQKKKAPELLITTPESLHLLLATKGYPKYFGQLKAVVVDEWHELVGSKRGVQMELALSRFRGLQPKLKVWGISATIGNMEEAIEVLMGNSMHERPFRLVKAKINKQIDVATILPDQIETFPWSGHLGIKLIHQVLPIIAESKSTLIFTNTRAQCEIWYQQLLEVAPDLAGSIAMHHSSIDRKLRDWVENALHEGNLKAVVCTSSLDLGVDFRPVETIIQVGSPKGVARFVQRAGRSGHQPGAGSRIYFLPTHSLELVEGAALRESIKAGKLESRLPYMRSFDVLVQYLITLAISEGFQAEIIQKEILGTYSFQSLNEAEWRWCLTYITSGGESLYAYDEYKKVDIEEDGTYKVNSKRVALRHRMQIGTISSDANLQVKYLRGGRIGSIEEWFVAQLKPGDTFWFAGRSLELIRIKEMIVQVKKSKKKTGKIPTWMGGRLPLSSQLSDALRIEMDKASKGHLKSPELAKLEPLFNIQSTRSHIPKADELLIEYFKSREGYHLVFFPFEGRFVHEGMGSLLAYRLSRLLPISFSIAMNDYGFELLSDVEIPIDEALKKGLFSAKNLFKDIQASINETELARRKFRDIASISGLIFKGYPGKQKKDRHVQASSQLFFEVFSDYDPDNLLLQQAHEEVMAFQLEEARLRAAFERIQNQKIRLIKAPKATPFAFPIMIDRLREKLSSEKLEDRIRKMKLQLVR
ncbi:MAG: ligase-associated DNA damage response DEXH box helicase [Saprospiraceae bacterium]